MPRDDVRVIAKRPSDEEAVRALRVLAQWLGLGAAPAIYTADALPPDCASRDAFLRTHRARVRARTSGWTRRGKVRAVTAEAWAADVITAASAAPRQLALVATSTPSLDAVLDRELGIRTSRKSGT
jgi:hypothetical protein